MFNDLLEVDKNSEELDLVEKFYLCLTDDEYFIENYCKVWVKNEKTFKKFLLLETQKRIITQYNAYEQNTVLKYRQGGITTVTCAWLAKQIVFNENIKIAVVANKVKLAQTEILSKVCSYVANLPDFLRIEPSRKDSQVHKIYSNGAEIQAFAATKDGLRGFSPDILIIDEAAYLDHGTEFWEAAGGIFSSGGRVIMISTPNGQDSLFYETINKSKQKQNDFNVIEIRWYEDRRYNKGLRWFKIQGALQYSKLREIYNNTKNYIETEEIKDFEALVRDGYKPISPWFIEQCKVYNNNVKAIAQELENKFLGSGGNMVAEEDIMRHEERYVLPPIKQEYHDSNFWIWQEPIKDRKYLLGADVALGNSDDFSTIQIIDLEEGEQVAEYQGKLPPEIFGDLIYRYGTIYNNAFTVVDITGGVGALTMHRLLELGYKNLYRTSGKAKQMQERLAELLKEDEGVPGFTIGSNNRTLLLNEMEKQLRLDEIKIRSTRLINEFKTFVWNESTKRFEHTRSTHDDLIFALGIALYGFNFNQNKQTNNDERLKAMLNSYIVSNQNGFTQTNGYSEIKQRGLVDNNPFFTNKPSNDKDYYSSLGFTMY